MLTVTISRQKVSSPPFLRTLYPCPVSLTGSSEDQAAYVEGQPNRGQVMVLRSFPEVDLMPTGLG